MCRIVGSTENVCWCVEMCELLLCMYCAYRYVYCMQNVMCNYVDCSYMFITTRRLSAYMYVCMYSLFVDLLLQSH